MQLRQNVLVSQPGDSSKNELQRVVQQCRLTFSTGLVLSQV
jgi:hypothetical protein